MARARQGRPAHRDAGQACRRPGRRARRVGPEGDPGAAEDGKAGPDGEAMVDPPALDEQSTEAPYFCRRTLTWLPAILAVGPASSRLSASMKARARAAERQPLDVASAIACRRTLASCSQAT